MGCFWIQIVLLIALLVLTPLSVVWAWPSMVSAALLILSLVLLFFVANVELFNLGLRVGVAGLGFGEIAHKVTIEAAVAVANSGWLRWWMHTS